jgi:hypothetical protein
MSKPWREGSWSGDGLSLAPTWLVASGNMLHSPRHGNSTHYSIQNSSWTGKAYLSVSVVVVVAGVVICVRPPWLAQTCV